MKTLESWKELKQKNIASVFLAAIFALLLLAPILVRTASTQTDAPDGIAVSASTSPTRIHEGDNTTITVEIINATTDKTYGFGIHVVNPVGAASVSNITITADLQGSGSNSTQYWGAFTGANTTEFGTYLVAVRNETTREVLATTSFTVEVWLCQLLARDRANRPVSNLTINAYNKTNVPVQFLNVSQVTNDTGWAAFMLATGNFTFEAFWKQVKVGSLPLTRIENDIVLQDERWVHLSNMKITVKDEATDEPLPFIQLRLEYNYTTESNENLTETRFFETNFTGTVHTHNLFINNSYVVEATRYSIRDLSLPPIQNETLPLPWNNITITFPVYTAFVHVADSKTTAVEGVRVEAHEWSGGLTQSETTDSNGNVTFSLTFGRYRVKVYTGAILLTETLVDLTQNQSSFLIRLSNHNIDFTVKVVDYFNQPIPNAVVKVEQKATTESAEDTTGPNGQATFSSILGGDSRIAVYIRGELSGTKDLYLTDSEKITFALSSYTVFLGYAIETSQFATALIITVMCIAFTLVLTYKRLLKIFVKRK